MSQNIKKMTNHELAHAIGQCVTLFAFEPGAQDGVPRGSIDLFGALLAERDRRLPGPFGHTGTDRGT